MSEINLKRKIAIYQNLTNDWSSPFIREYYESESTSEYTRLTEVAEIDFVALPDEVAIQSAAKKLDMKIEKIKTDTIAEIEELTQRKQELLSLTFQETK